MITAAGDSAGGFATLGILPAADHKPGEMISVEATHEDEVKSRAAKIPQVPHTYQVLGGLINEHQLALSETTFGGRKELLNPQGLLRYGVLMSLALQRARTAREAIDVMTKLVAEYGYADEGESISIADTQGGVDPGDRRRGPRRQRRGLGRLPRPRRSRLLPRQPVAHRRNPPRRSDQLALLRKRRELRHKPRLVRSEVGPAVPLLRGLLPADAVAAADLRRAGVEHFAACGAVAASFARLPPRQARLAALSAFAAARSQALGGRRHGPDARPLRRDRVRHDQGHRRRPLRACRAAGGRWSGRSTASNTPGSGRSRRSRPRFPASRNRGRGCPTRSAAWSGTAWTTATPLAICPSTAASTPCPRVSPPARSRSSPGIRPGGSSTSPRTTPTRSTRYITPEIQAAQKDIESTMLALQAPGRKDGARAIEDQPEPDGPLPDRLLGDARRADDGPLARRSSSTSSPSTTTATSATRKASIPTSAIPKSGSAACSKSAPSNSACRWRSRRISRTRPERAGIPPIRRRLSPFAPRKKRCFRGAKGDDPGP